MIDIDAIGAGGGSIAYIDPGGAFASVRALRAPNPVGCYAKGGDEPTARRASGARAPGPGAFPRRRPQDRRVAVERRSASTLAEPLKLSLTRPRLAF